ncbi:hypothetical protein ADJ70_15590 [Olsenella sp. oral taxon 807]|uniref:DNA polymerase III subunit gamma/tau n=1 Tax=Olsenella sp. oral taxon 807 TaxID=712411 RepID=UPI00068399CB|nr:DNA polymerase III subunit gamma/tau [Olsenella sp. oral taxon 807]AKU78373.1 hypothetical protein ADJ70_15590 [Olsenella sp. oral taxon 807]
MESLYRKYRPKTFEDVVGQQHVVSTLEHAVLEGRTSHAYLFCGPRGTGKTTMARILAKALMCERGAGQLPDGTCENCQLIAAGEHPDVYELDAASRTGVDNVREEIIGRVSFAPVRGSYKVYIIDEVHMLTTAAFNALLKTLEEPPEHIVFVLCTTDPQKVPETILSRVQRFDFHAIGASDILGQLKRVCDAEGFSYDEAALELVVRHARGGMRDALSALEQLSTFGGGSVSLDAARDLLGEVSSSMLTELTGALARRDVPTVFARIGELVESGRDLLQLARELSAHLRDVYVASVVGEGASTLPVAGDELRQLKDEALAFGAPDRVARALAVMSEVSSEMRVATNQRLALEVALTRIARPKSDLTLDSLAERVAQLEKTVEALAAGSASVPMSTTPASSLTAPAPAPTAPAPTSPDPTPQASARQTISAPQVAPAPVHAERPEPQAPQPPTLEQRTQSTSQEPQQVPASVARQAPQELLTSKEAPLASPAQPAPQQRSSEGASQSDQTTGAGAAQQPQPPDAAVQPRKETAPTTPAVTPATPAVTPATPAVTPAAPAITDGGELQRRWRQVVDGLVRTDPPRGSLLAASTALEDDGHRLLINLPKGSSFVTKMLDRKDVRATVEAAVRQAFGERALVYAESSLVGADIARSRAKAPAPTPARGTMVTPQPLSASQGQATPQVVSSVVTQRGHAPAPQPAMSHAAAPATAPQTEPPVEEVPLESYYDMPWDEPSAYEDEPMAPVGEASLAAEPQVASRAVPGPEPVRQTSQQVEPRTAVVFEAQAANTAESKPKPDPKPKAKTAAKTEPKQKPESDPKPKPDPKPKSKAEPKPRSKPKGSQSAPKRADGMPQDMNELLAMLTEVFGDGVEASVEKLQDSAVEQN